MTYRFGIATGPWNTISTVKANYSLKPAASVTLRDVFPHESVIRLDANPSIAWRGEQFQSLLGASPPLGEVARRIIALDAGGNEVPLGREDAHDTGEQSISVSDETMARVAKFRLQTRPYLWAEFADIALQPNVTPSNPVASPPALPGYKHTYACGITIELPGVTKQGAGPRWWRPDGKSVAGPWKEFIGVVRSPDWETPSSL